MAADGPALTGTLTADLRRSWRLELAAFVAAYLAYSCARWIVAGDPDTAQRHAHWIFHLEQTVGIAIEHSVQGYFDHAAPERLFSAVYLTAQFVVLPAALVWLYHRSPERYRTLRNTIVAAWLLAVPVFALFPVAPPRLAGLGFFDTVSQQPSVSLTGRSTLFYNPLAAVPSLHVGFAAAVSLALAGAARGRVTRVLALSWGPLVALAVIATGNHYLLDIPAGLAVTALGFYAGRRFTAGSPG